MAKNPLISHLITRTMERLIKEKSSGRKGQNGPANPNASHHSKKNLFIDHVTKSRKCFAAYQKETQKQHLDGTAGKQSTASCTECDYIIVLLFSMPQVFSS